MLVLTSGISVLSDLICDKKADYKGMYVSLYIRNLILIVKLIPYNSSTSWNNWKTK